MSIQIETTTHLQVTVRRLAEIVQGMYPCSAFERMTCDEAEAFADVLRAGGFEPEAAIIIEQHAEGDDEPTDLHHAGYLQYLDDLARQI